MRIFLTGATGFVGHHVAQALAEEGADLRLLVRKSSNLANLEGIAGDTVVGDLADRNLSLPRSRAAMPSSTWPQITASGFATPMPCTAPTSMALVIC